MIERDEDEFAQKVAQHRVLKAQIKALEEKLKTLRDEMDPIVRDMPDEKWKDDVGYARIKHRAASVSFVGKEVDKLAQVWSESQDATTRTHGELLLTHRKERPPTSHLEVK